MPAIFVRIFIKNEQEDSKNALPQRLGYICCAIVAHLSFLLRLKNRCRKDIKRMLFISLLKRTPLHKIFFFFYFAEVGGGTEAYDGFGRREVRADVKLGAQMANSDGVASRASN